MNHAAVHWDGVSEDVVKHFICAGVSHCVDTSFGQCEIDGLREIQRGGGWVS